MSKHTPGPWELNSFAVEAPLDGGTEVVAHVYNDREAPPTGSARANARLIASAPDLLEALVLARATLFHAHFCLVPDAPCECGRDNVERVVNAALAKARGE